MKVKVKFNLTTFTLSAVLGLLLLFSGSSNSYAETNEANTTTTNQFSEEVDMKAFEKFVQEIKDGKITSEPEATERLKELNSMEQADSNPTIALRSYGGIPTFLGAGAETNACLKEVGAFKCGNARLAADVAIDAAKKYYGTSTASLRKGKGDALRHSLWNALMCRDVGCSAAKTIADNHEKYNRNETKNETDMDYYNNQKGRDMYNYRIKNGYNVQVTQQLIDHLRQDIRHGYLKYVSKEGWLLWTNQ